MLKSMLMLFGAMSQSYAGLAINPAPNTPPSVNPLANQPWLNTTGSPAPLPPANIIVLESHFDIGPKLLTQALLQAAPNAGFQVKNLLLEADSEASYEQILQKQKDSVTYSNSLYSEFVTIVRQQLDKYGLEVPLDPMLPLTLLQDLVKYVFNPVDLDPESMAMIMRRLVPSQKMVQLIEQAHQSSVAVRGIDIDMSGWISGWEVLGTVYLRGVAAWAAADRNQAISNNLRQFFSQDQGFVLLMGGAHFPELYQVAASSNKPFLVVYAGDECDPVYGYACDWLEQFKQEHNSKITFIEFPFDVNQQDATDAAAYLMTTYAAQPQFNVCPHRLVPG